METKRARQRVEARRVVDAYRATGVGVIQSEWGDVDADGGRYACGLGVCMLAGELATMDELCAGFSDAAAAERLGVSHTYAVGFVLGFDGLVGPDSPEAELREVARGHLSDWRAVADALVPELREGIADGAAAFAAVEEAERRGVLMVPHGEHYVDAATATGMYDHD